MTTQINGSEFKAFDTLETPAPSSPPLPAAGAACGLFCVAVLAAQWAISVFGMLKRFNVALVDGGDWPLLKAGQNLATV